MKPGRFRRSRSRDRDRRSRSREFRDNRDRRSRSRERRSRSKERDRRERRSFSRERDRKRYTFLKSSHRILFNVGFSDMKVLMVDLVGEINRGRGPRKKSKRMILDCHLILPN